MTSPNFPNHIGIDIEPGGERFTLTRDFIYNDEEKDIRVIVPTGFSTDFNSTPRAIWWYFAPWDHPEAGVVHDWLYNNPSGYTHLSGAAVTPLDREQCDQLHRRILDLKGMRWTKRQAVWTALRVGGGVAWNRHHSKDTTTSSG